MLKSPLIVYIIAIFCFMLHKCISAYKRLSRIRTQLSDKQSPIPKTRSPAGFPGRSPHSPLGKYRRSTPPYLPRLDTPPDAESGQPLRGSRYGTVPPVYKKHVSRQSDYDSWGEESDSEEDEDQGQYMPQPYPMQPYPGPPQVVFGAPFPMFYPPPPPQRRKLRDKGRGEPERIKQYKTPNRDRDRFEDVERSVPSKSKKKNRVQFNSVPTSFYPFPTYPYPYPAFYEDQQPRKKKESKYKYIQSRDTPYSADLPDNNVYQSFKNDPDPLMYYYIKDHPLFGENLVNSFISQCLDEFIPDILIDVLKKRGPLDAPSPLHAIRDDIIGRELPNILHGIVKSTLNEMVDEYMLQGPANQDPLESFLTRLVNDAVKEASTSVVKETVREMAREYVEYKHVDEVLDDLMTDYLNEIGQELVQDAVIDLIAEDFIETEVINPDLGEEIPNIATEVLSHYDTKVMRRELKEVSKHAGDKLMESILLDYLLALVARQGKVWTESDHADMYMDDLIGTLLLEQLFNVNTQRRKTVNNKSMKKIHEKAVTDVALDVLIQQLSASLDEDLLDVDEYERGITDPYFNLWSPYNKVT